MASDCPVITNNGQTVTCIPNETGYEFARFDGMNMTSYQVIPNLIDCDIDVQQVTEITALLTLLLIAAWGIQMMKRPIR